jgi:predicted nucleic acid-binding protein
MIVIADTSPLNYLIQIDCDDLLPKLFKTVFIPPAVMQELQHGGAPDSVKAWVSRPPSWIEVHTLKASPDPSLLFLDPGEREAIQLAQEEQADVLLIDEHKGRKEATRRGLVVTGTIGVLLAAGELGFVDPKVAVHRLVAETTFRITLELRKLLDRS